MKKPSILLSSQSSMSCLHFFAPTSNASPPRSTQTTSSRRTPRTQHRYYAQVTDDATHRLRDDLSWPKLPTPYAVPSPYQIFNIKKGAPYSKQRFYELVKLYHPDRNGHQDVSSFTVSHAVKLERYRLIVAANVILSDPVRRNAYDAWGAGWNGQPEIGRPAFDRDGPFSHGAGWRRGGWDDCSRNATWEDWERWYNRNEQKPPRARTISNGAFVSFIVMFAVFGGTVQATRAGNSTLSLIEQRDLAHGEASRQLRRVRQETRESFGNRDERIQNFMKIRDPKGYGVIDPQEEAYRRVFPQPEVCSSEDIARRDMKIYRPAAETE